MSCSSRILRKKGIAVVQVGLDNDDDSYIQHNQVQSEHVHETGQSSATAPSTRKPRTKTRCLDVQDLESGFSIPVAINRFSQPIGPSGTSFRQYLGTVARNGNLCPLNYEDWRKMPDTTKTEQIVYIKSKYKYHDSLSKFINKSLAAKWRGYKARLKKKYFKPNKSEAWNCTHIPPDVMPLQWHFLVKHFSSTEGKKLSTIGINSRLALKENHTLGSKSFANRIEEMERASGNIVGAVDFFEASRTNKNGEIVNVEAINILEKAKIIMNEYNTKNPNASKEKLNIKQREAMTEIRGKEVGGRVRGLGLGPTPSMVGLLGQGSISYHNGEVDALRKRVVELEGKLSKVAELEEKWSKMAALEEKMSWFISSIKEPARHVFSEKSPPAYYPELVHSPRPPYCYKSPLASGNSPPPPDCYKSPSLPSHYCYKSPPPHAYSPPPHYYHKSPPPPEKPPHPSYSPPPHYYHKSPPPHYYHKSPRAYSPPIPKAPGFQAEIHKPGGPGAGLDEPSAAPSSSKSLRSAYQSSSWKYANLEGAFAPQNTSPLLGPSKMRSFQVQQQGSGWTRLFKQ